MTWERSSRATDLLTVRSRAKATRREMTDAERKLCWSLRRDLRFEGTRFRRQVPIRRHIADFASLSPGLIVEVDGEQHSRERDQACDLVRNAYLNNQDFRILRFWNSEDLPERQSVIDTIFAAMQERISPGDVS
jgi:very-short-patch-repair endonuclease